MTSDVLTAQKLFDLAIASQTTSAVLLRQGIALLREELNFATDSAKFEALAEQLTTENATLKREVETLKARLYKKKVPMYHATETSEKVRRVE